MPLILLIDIGSTFTKLTLVDKENEHIVTTSSSYTTPSNVLEGFNQAIINMEIKLNKKISYSEAYACSSAKGGLKMAAIGLIESLTTKAAKEACLGAGAKLELVFSNKLSNKDIKELETSDIDIILLAGGTDGGNTEVVLYNANKIALSNIKVPIIYAGNKDALDEIESILNHHHKHLHTVDNIMPKLNVLNIDMAKKKIHEIFITEIIKAKGMDNISKMLNDSIYPTPSAVLMAAELLSKGPLGNNGLGELVLLDIGGATTDVYSLSYGLPKKENVIFSGLEEPFSKRTVEGDLGMRISSSGIIPYLNKSILDKMIKEFNLLTELEKRQTDTSYLPTSELDKKIDAFIAKNCATIAFSRHVGSIKPVYTHYGTVFEQLGKDLTSVKYIIATGGTLIYNNENNLDNLIELNNPLLLAPKDAKVIVDKSYIISTMGLLSIKYPDLAFKLLNNHLFKGEL